MTLWPTVPLGQVVRHRKDFIEISDLSRYKRCRVQLHGQGIVLRDIVEGSHVKTKKQLVCQEGDFLVAEIDAKVGGYGIVPRELDGAIVSSHYFLFEVDQSRLLRSFLGYFVRTPAFRRQVQAQGSTNYAAVRPHEVLEYRVPLPTLPEQHRCVERLDSVAAKIAEAKALRESAARGTSVMVDLEIRASFEQGARSGWYPGQLGDYIVDARYGTSDKSTDDSSGLPILRMGNIQEGRLDIRDLRFLRVAPQDTARLLLRKGDILVNRTNSAELVGKCAVFDLDGDYGFASYLIRLRLDASRANPRFVARYINSPIGRSYMMAERKQMTGQANINTKKLRALPLLLPSLGEQGRIVAGLDDLQRKQDVLKGLQAETAAELDALLPSLLDRTFRGEL